MKMDKRKCILLVALLLVVIALTIWLLLPRYELDVHKDYGIGLFADVTNGYSRVQSERKTYTSDDVICLTVSTAYLNSLEKAELARRIRFLAEENPVFDISFDIGTEHKVDWDQSQSDYIFQEKYWVLELPDDEIDVKDLVFGKNVFGFTNHDDMDFTFHVYLKVKEDAPEDWGGRIFILTELSGVKDSYGNAVHGRACVDYLTYEKNGDQITLD